ncbi:MAG: DUF2911 domain-containing protein [Acidobacteria bacterium]|nr:DUF2911 domain-containing protein [Acidobacteriota bacterium]
MKNYRYTTSMFLTALLTAALALLSACAGSNSNPGTSASPAAGSSQSASTAPAQSQPASPSGSAEVSLNGKKISVEYSRPSMRGRKIFGELVPYDQIWRTGANKATHFTTEADLTVGNVAVPKGTYTLYTIPGQKGWKLIINKQTGQWGTPYKSEYEKDELGRIDMQVEALPSPVEQFTIALDQTGDGGVLKLEWEQTRSSVKFSEKK